MRDENNGRISHIGIRMTACLLILIFMLSCSLSAAADESPEFEMKENTVTHDIAIVFDHSRSMYQDTDRWSQSLYAIGVIASMLDYDAGDKLGIYPMETISVGKDGPKISDRLEITKDNIGDISKIYCEETSDTIFRPSYSARDYLVQSDADEKWLIVMTDGEFYFDKDSKTEDGEKKNADWVQDRLDALLKDKKESNVIYNDMFKRQYLGFGEAVSIPSNPDAGLYATNVSDADQLAPALVDICNMIFQRQKVENVGSDGGFDIGVSMKNIVAFAQGSGAAIKSLKDADGSEMEKSIDIHVNAGDQGTRDQFYQGRDADGKPIYDESKPQYDCPSADVTGQVVTFPDCPAGSYTLNFTPGADVEVYYEPDVRIDAFLVNMDGETVDVEKTIVPGRYAIAYHMIDAKTGEDVTDKDELKPIDYHSTLTTDGEEKSIEQGEDVELVEGSDVKLTVTADVLGGKYQVEKVFILDVRPPDPDNYKLSIRGSKTLYKPDKDNWKPFSVEITKNGQPLTDEELSALKTEFTFSDGSPAKVSVCSGESAFNVEYAKNEDGSFAEEIKAGKVTLNASVAATDQFGREQTAEGSRNFKVSDLHPIVPLLITISIIGLLIALIIFFLTRKVLPRGVSMNNNSNITVQGRADPTLPDAPTYSRRGLYKSSGTLGIHMPGVPIQGPITDACSATFTLKAVDTILCKSKNRKMRVIAATSDCDYICINGARYDRDANGKFNFPDPPILSNSQIDLVKEVNVGGRRRRTLQLSYYITRR